MKGLYLVFSIVSIILLIAGLIVIVGSAVSRRKSQKQLMLTSPIRLLTDSEKAILSEHHCFVQTQSKRKRHKAYLKSDEVRQLSGEYFIVRQKVQNKVIYIHTINNVPVILPLDAEEQIQQNKPEMTEAFIESMSQLGAVQTYLDEFGQEKVFITTMLDAEVVLNSHNELVVISIKDRFDLETAAKRHAFNLKNREAFLNGQLGAYYDYSSNEILYELIAQREESPIELKRRTQRMGISAGFFYLLTACFFLINLNIDSNNTIAIWSIFIIGIITLILAISINVHYRILPKPLKINHIRGRCKDELIIDHNKNIINQKRIGGLNIDYKSDILDVFYREYRENKTLEIELYADSLTAIAIHPIISIEQLDKKFPPINLLKHVVLLAFGLIIGLFVVYTPMTFHEMSSRIINYPTRSIIEINNSTAVDAISIQTNQEIAYSGISYCPDVAIPPLQSYVCKQVKTLLPKEPKAKLYGGSVQNISELHNLFEHAFSGGILFRFVDEFGNETSLYNKFVIDHLVNNQENHALILDYLYDKFEEIYSENIQFSGLVKEIIRNPNDPQNPIVLVIDVTYKGITAAEFIIAIGYLIMTLLMSYLIFVHGLIALIRYDKYQVLKQQKKQFLKELRH